ncbi:arylamine N-acetyltransferase [Spirillospora sp. NPDC047279]|uniref:arylamine N-acetyltransferase family protein n=1 Tax=Spirillospora sp. NPDC047279 TaxID=3155478 RepID=UPI0033D40A5C
MSIDVDGYLARLGLPRPGGGPSVAGLRRLHEAHVERIPYEALDIQLGRMTSIDPYWAAERITAKGRGGYCYHLNGAFSLLLRELGYDVTWHRSGGQNHGEPPPGSAWANHLGLTVHGLPDEESPSGDWLIDAGMGDGIHGPLPLRYGEYTQGPMTFRLSRSDTDPGGWRFDHDPGGSFAGMDFAPAVAEVGAFAERHEYLSTSPRSGFVRTCVVMRREARGVDSLTGCVLRRAGDLAPPRTIDDQAEWWAVLDEIFGLRPADLDPAERAVIWDRVHSAHKEWQRTRPA